MCARSAAAGGGRSRRADFSALTDTIVRSGAGVLAEIPDRSVVERCTSVVKDLQCARRQVCSPFSVSHELSRRCLGGVDGNSSRTVAQSCAPGSSSRFLRFFSLAESLAAVWQLAFSRCSLETRALDPCAPLGAPVGGCYLRCKLIRKCDAVIRCEISSVLQMNSFVSCVVVYVKSCGSGDRWCGVTVSVLLCIAQAGHLAVRGG